MTVNTTEGLQPLLEAFTDPTQPHNVVLTQALELAGYQAVANATMAALAGHIPVELTDAVLAMSKQIALDGGPNPDAGFVLTQIATSTWEAVGLPADARQALTWEQRVGIIDVVMGVSKSIIAQEAAMLVALTDLDTSVPVEEPAEG